MHEYVMLDVQIIVQMHLFDNSREIHISLLAHELSSHASMQSYS